MNTGKLLAASLLGLGLALAFVWLLGASLAAAAPTAVFNVNKLTDSADGTCDGDCSLREAIIAANNNAGADVISLTVVGTYELTIPGVNEGYAATGDLDIRDDLTIVGQGPGATIIDANGIDRVFHLNAGTVVISGVTIMGGAPPSGGGGGIYNSNTDLSLTNVAVVSNSAVLYGGAGGGIRLAGTDAVLTMDENSTLARNEAYGGGGVAIIEGARATLNAGQIISNSATLGGGVYIQQSDVTLSGVQVLSNTATASGGGVYSLNGAVTLSGGSIVSNTASTNGGGVYVSGSTFTQTGVSTIAHNTAAMGGGVFVNTGRAVLNGGQIVGNRSSGEGGGVCVYQADAALIQTGDSTIIENTAGTHGGGVSISVGQATLSGGQIVSNTASESGGGVYITGGGSTAFTQTAGLIAYNTAEGTDADDGGGGIYSRFLNIRVTLSGGQVLGNQAARGGGLYIRLGNVAMLGGQIIGNDAAYGGGVYAGTVGWHVPLEGGQIISNTAKYGGGLYAATGSVTMERGQIVGNRADAEGGGVYHAAGVLTLINTTVSGNAADDGSGLANAGGTIVLTHTTVVSNRAGTGGRGIGVAALGSVLVKNTIVAYNIQGNCESGALTSNDHNLDDDGTCGLGESNDKSGVDPQLAPLAYDRGTLVHAIAPGTPAHDAGACQTGITTDQRGLPRLAPCDMGAYEYVHAQVHLPLVLRNY